MCGNFAQLFRLLLLAGDGLLYINMTTRIQGFSGLCHVFMGRARDHHQLRAQAQQTIKVRHHRRTTNWNPAFRATFRGAYEVGNPRPAFREQATPRSQAHHPNRKQSASRGPPNAHLLTRQG